VRIRLTAVALACGTCAALAIAPALAHAVAPANAELRLAYIDPGSGSFVLQALIAAVAGAAVAINAYWRKIKSLLGLRSTKPEADETESDSNHA